ncbi:hypothetical protein EV426DRAFT_711218 [Tirmania nivea]|nr:hypothetical protein EV426DRAFT_711218 [Tirmania nivea]
MRDQNFGKHKSRERSPSTGGVAEADVSDDRSPRRNKRVKKHHCHQQTNSSRRRGECAGCEPTVAIDAHESKRVTASTTDNSNRENHSLTEASNAQLRKHEVSRNKTTQSSRSRRKKKRNAIKKARKAAAEREAAMIAATKAEEECTTRKQVDSKEVQIQQQQEHAAMVGATKECIIQGGAEGGQSSIMRSKDSKELKREKRAARKARGKERGTHDLENPEALQSSTEVARIQDRALGELVIGENPGSIVKDASTQVPDITQTHRCVSPASADNNSSCAGFEMAETPMVHGMEDVVRTEPFGNIDGSAGAHNQEGIHYKFPGLGAKHWCKLTLEQRMTKIDLNPVGSGHGRKHFIWAKVEDGPVYASIVDLSCSSEILDMLIHWLQSRIVNGTPATDLGNTLLAQTWKLLEFVLRDDEDKLDEMKINFKYARELTPKIQKWETVQLKTEKTFAEIESLWGKSWKEQCVVEIDIAGLRSVKWKRGIVKQVKKLASTAMERDIGRAEAWGLVLKEVLAKGERNAVVAEDVWVVTETLIQR